MEKTVFIYDQSGMQLISADSENDDITLADIFTTDRPARTSLINCSAGNGNSMLTIGPPD